MPIFTLPFLGSIRACLRIFFASSGLVLIGLLTGGCVENGVEMVGLHVANHFIAFAANVIIAAVRYFRISF